MHILEKIVNHKKEEVQKNKELYPIKLLENSIYFNSPCVSLKKYLNREDKAGIIAEFKKRSPSKPSINLYADVEKITLGYMMAGASALSVLTDNHFFGGSNEDLKIARKFNFCPILRKDFMIDEYQLLEARSIGADVILLIAEILDKANMARLAQLAKSLGMEVIMEIHTRDHIEKYNESIDIVGVNNRDLDTFKVNPEHSIELFPYLPENALKISESGIHQVETLLRLKNAGYHGFLIGERFMAEADPVRSCEKFIREFKKNLQDSSAKQTLSQVL